MKDLEDLARQVPGPIVVTGVNGFIASHLVSQLRTVRADVHALSRTTNPWRAKALDVGPVIATPSRGALMEAVRAIKPKTIFNLAAHGAYEFQTDRERMVDVNFLAICDLTDVALSLGSSIIQAGSSSEFGRNSQGPTANSVLQPNSMYAITKAAASQWLSHQARENDLRSCTLRLYSVYGPVEDPGRLFPTLIRKGLRSQLPPFASASTSRDFVYVADVVQAFILSAIAVHGHARGQDISICTGRATTMAEIAHLACTEFRLSQEPEFGSISRAWDLDLWYGDPHAAEHLLGWRATTSLTEGLALTRRWYEAPGRREFLEQRQDSGAESEAQRRLITPCLSGVVACYRDADAMPYLYERFKQTATELGLDFELIFVNDASPDNAIEVLEALSALDSRVIGIHHSRNFGSQSAFLSGMRRATGDYVVLMDGDLQDPPELLLKMWSKMLEGFDIVYGHRADREAPWIMNKLYRIFYRIFDKLAPFHIPRNAGDFSLMSRSVVDVLVEMPERDLFIRAQRAYLGFRQVGVDYIRPERMFGRSTNNLRRNFGWATRGVLAVSRAPLTGLSVFALGLFFVALALIVLQVVARLFFPDLAPQGLTSISILVLGLGAVNLLAVAVVGEYVGRVLEESKRRPRFITSALTESGRTIPVERWDRG